jgi:hypothetical protein
LKKKSQARAMPFSEIPNRLNIETGAGL